MCARVHAPTNQPTRRLQSSPIESAAAFLADSTTDRFGVDDLLDQSRTSRVLTRIFCRARAQEVHVSLSRVGLRWLIDDVGRAAI